MDGEKYRIISPMSGIWLRLCHQTNPYICGHYSVEDNAHNVVLIRMSKSGKKTNKREWQSTIVNPECEICQATKPVDVKQHSIESHHRSRLADSYNILQTLTQGGRLYLF